MADKIIGPDDFELAKVYSYGEKPERQKRQLSPEMEQAVKDTSGLGASFEELQFGDLRPSRSARRQDGWRPNRRPMGDVTAHQGRPPLDVARR
jgi:hypothetical protein